MQRFVLLSALIFLLAFPSNGQSSNTKLSNDDAASERLWLIFDLQGLEAKALKLDTPLARALAKAEIADAAWTLDQAWSKKLLREAYDLTFPTEEYQIGLRNKPVGAPPVTPSGSEIAQNGVRRRVLEIATRDKAFADELVQLGAERLGKQKEHYLYAELASKSIADGDTEAASNYIFKALDADPTLINAGINIFDIAARDRVAADKIIVRYIERLRAAPLSMADQSAWRSYLFLSDLVFNRSRTYLIFTGRSADEYQRMQPAGPSVMRAYVGFMIESLSALEQREPGSAMRFRGYITSTWPLVGQYAPELTGAFSALEQLSRRPGGDASLPQTSNEEASKARYEKRVKDALDSGQPDDLTINFALGRGDFDKARKMIGKLADGAQKTQLTEHVNTLEAISLATKGDTLGAERLAEQLNKATSMLQVYPLIINKCAARKDQSCVISSFYQAVKQLKRGDTTPYAPPQGVPALVAQTNRDLDPVLLSLSKLAKAVASINDTLALEALDEMAAAANSSDMDTGQGRTGFDTDVFKLLAPKNEARVRQAATTLKDQLRQIVALAAIDQWKAKELAEKAKASLKKSD
jgi:DNA-directed RNA polymerase specialized sigma24 family protein